MANHPRRRRQLRRRNKTKTLVTYAGTPRNTTSRQNRRARLLAKLALWLAACLGLAALAAALSGRPADATTPFDSGRPICRENAMRAR